MEGGEVPTGAENIAPKHQLENHRVGDANVALGWVETSPKNPIEQEGRNPQKGVIFIGAWNWQSDFPIMTGISQKMADGFGQTVYQVDSKTDKIGPDSYQTRAEAVARFVAARKFSEVTLVGHSEGGLIAADLAVMLERNHPEVQIDGLVLLDPMGMYQRTAIDLAAKYVSDPIKVAPKEFKDTGVVPPKGGALQQLIGLWRDIKYFGLNYPKELTRQLKGMASLNPLLGEIKAPVLVLTGERDYVSDYRSYLPSEEVDKRMETISPDEKYPKHEAMFRRGKARREILREKIVPQAENAMMIIISKGAHHAGVTDIRMEQAAKVASRMFERMRRSAPSTKAA